MNTYTIPEPTAWEGCWIIERFNKAACKFECLCSDGTWQLSVPPPPDVARFTSREAALAHLNTEE